MSVKLLAIVIIDFKRYSCTYCLMQGTRRCFIRSNLLNATVSEFASSSSCIVTPHELDLIMVLNVFVSTIFNEGAHLT